MQIDLNQKVAVVTGASSGIGKAIAMGMALNGAKVVLVSSRIERLIKVRDEIKEKGNNCTIVEADVSDFQAVKNIFSRTISLYSKIDILVNAAGVTVRKPFEQLQEEDWDLVNNVNLKGIFLCCKEALRHMKKQQYGKIVNIASSVSFLGIKNIAPYCASKGGVVQLTRALAVEYGSYNININAVSPGYIYTDLVKDFLKDPQNSERILNRMPLGRFGQPDDVLGIVAFLCSDLSSFITGENIFIDGGYTIFG